MYFEVRENFYCFALPELISVKTSSPKDNDRSPESNVPRSNLISKKHINGPFKPEARNRTRPSFYAYPGYKHRSKMNELAWIYHFHIIRLWEFFRRSRAPNSVVSGPIWPKFELVRGFRHVLVTCKYIKDRVKSNREKVETPFSPL